MCKKTLCGTRDLKLESGKTLKLKYYIIEKPQNNKSHYGIQIAEETDEERSILYKEVMLSESKTLVVKLIYEFIKNSVTPVTMEYIVDDIMTQIPC